MNLEEIEVRGLQARERGFDRVENGCAGESSLVDVLRQFVETGYSARAGAWIMTVYDARADGWIIGDKTEAFRCNNDLVTGDLILGRTMSGARRSENATVPFG